MASLTGANSVITLGCTILFPIAQQLQGFAVDDVFDTEAVTTVETLMGVDNILSAGWVATSKKQTFNLQSDSPSNAMFDLIWQYQESNQEALTLFGETTLKAIGRQFIMARGFLTSYMPIPAVKKLIQPRKYTVEWQHIQPVNV
jgi:hypothetical protein